MHKIYYKKLKNFRLNPKLSLLRSSTQVLIHLTTNFALVLKSQPIT